MPEVGDYYSLLDIPAYAGFVMAAIPDVRPTLCAGHNISADIGRPLLESFVKVAIDSLEELGRWLSRNYGNTESVWLVRFRKSVPAKCVDRLEVLDDLHCWG